MSMTTPTSPFSGWPSAVWLAAGATLLALGCSATPDPHGSLVSALDGPGTGPPPAGQYECAFRFVRLEADLPADSLASRHIQETSDRLYGKRPVSHATENCEVRRQSGGAKFLLVPGQRWVQIRPVSATAFFLEWDDRTEFRQIEAGTYQGEIRTISGVETVTLYHLDGDEGEDPAGDPGGPR